MKEEFYMYDVIIVGAGPGGIFTAYELAEKKPGLKIAVFEMGHELKKRKWSNPASIAKAVPL